MSSKSIVIAHKALPVQIHKIPSDLLEATPPPPLAPLPRLPRCLARRPRGLVTRHGRSLVSLPRQRCSTCNLFRASFFYDRHCCVGLYMNAQVQSQRAKEMFTPCPPHRVYNVRGCRVVTLIFFLAFIAVFFLVSFADVSISRLFYLSPSQSSRSELHGIMFDAGSTGSRIHVYTFVKTAGKTLGDLSL